MYKALLIAIAEIISKSDSLEEAYAVVLEMANAEGVILKSLEERRTERRINIKETREI